MRIETVIDKLKEIDVASENRTSTVWDWLRLLKKKLKEMKNSRKDAKNESTMEKRLWTLMTARETKINVMGTHVPLSRQEEIKTEVCSTF